MPAVKQPGIDAVPLAPALASGDDGDTAARSDRFVDSAEARRREQLEHDNVQMAALVPAPVLPPAPPARLAVLPKRDGGTEAAEPAGPAVEGGGEAARGAPKALIGVRPRPAWQRFAAPIPTTGGTGSGTAATDGRARVAIVLDDMG